MIQMAWLSSPAPDPRISTPENRQIWPIDRSPMSTDVGRKPKSASLRHVTTALAEERAVGGQIWAGWFLRSSDRLLSPHDTT
jgi:hypothetical protein